jgi:hypothetical protein
MELFKKLWICCHLLYPNPSQARDIFGFIVESGIDHSQKKEKQLFQGLQKLFRLYRKQDPVKSGSNFFEFSQTPLNYWKRVQQKCSKDETFILMAMLLEMANFKNLSLITRHPESKVRYLFNQGVKKVITSPVLRIDQKKEIKFKDYYSQDVTLLFVNEHLIEYFLGLSEKSVAEKMESRLKDLPVSHHFDEVMKIFGNSAQLQNIKKMEVKQQKWIFAGLVTLIAIVTTLIIRPDFLRNPITDNSANKLVLGEIEISKKEIADADAVAAIAPTSATALNKAVSASVAIVASAVSAPVKVTSLPKPTAKAMAVPMSQPVSSPVKVALPSGVFRGAITVTDFEQVTSIIRDRVIAIGGKKAGEVELGWIKKQSTSYFHFIFPAEKKNELVAFIQQYGNLEYKFEPHPRVLGIGQGRFILEVHKGE